ncbi:SIS domain-containing protein [Thermaerobacter composti]|uniref:SIS domain-containing protein n=1 Tax=Thermaerobacter composti TaxID=554949 RepID=A0ABZ0QPL5_9FIRM|nr:SIS domain-containing protein [Thermaerobacter composti]WPD18609.1 SIS domain-containing protein [Thermaerobacter composti]
MEGLAWLDRYFAEVTSRLERVRTTQREALQKAARAIADCVAAGGLVHVHGCGHTQILVEEVWYRAGQPAYVSPLFDQALWPHNGPARASALEKLPGYGTLLADAHDLRPGEVGIVLSNSGRNPTPIEVALRMRDKGLTVVAITSMDYTTQVASKHPSGKRLFEIADIVIDNAGPLGDAAVSLPNGRRAAPVTTITNAATLGALFLEANAELLRRGIEPPVFVSANLDQGPDVNETYVSRYAGRVHYYRT